MYTFGRKLMETSRVALLCAAIGLLYVKSLAFVAICFFMHIACSDLFVLSLGCIGSRNVFKYQTIVLVMFP